MFDAVRRLTDLTERLDAIRNVSAPLLRNDPDHAADELVTVLQEVVKTLNAFEVVLVRYLSLRFTEASGDRDVAELVRLEGGAARTMVREMRARSGKIGALYRTSLAQWFNAAPLQPDERDALHRLFQELEDSDANAINPAVDELATWLEEEVDTTSALVAAGLFTEAGERILAARRKVTPLRRTMGRIVGELRDLEIQFTA